MQAGGGAGSGGSSRGPSGASLGVLGAQPCSPSPGCAIVGPSSRKRGREVSGSPLQCLLEQIRRLKLPSVDAATANELLAPFVRDALRHDDKGALASIVAQFGWAGDSFCRAVDLGGLSLLLQVCSYCLYSLHAAVCLQSFPLVDFWPGTTCRPPPAIALRSQHSGILLNQSYLLIDVRAEIPLREAAGTWIWVVCCCLQGAQPRNRRGHCTEKAALWLRRAGSSVVYTSRDIAFERAAPPEHCRVSSSPRPVAAMHCCCCCLLQSPLLLLLPPLIPQ